jgi:hypothetical protein
MNYDSFDFNFPNLAALADSIAEHNEWRELSESEGKEDLLITR